MVIPPVVAQLLEEEAVAIITRLTAAAEKELPVLFAQFEERLSHLADRIGGDVAAKIKALLASKPAPAAQSPSPVPPAAAATPAPVSEPPKAT